MSPPPSLSPPYPTSPAPQAHTLHTPTSPPTTLPASYLSSLWSDYIFLKGFASSPLVLSVLGPNIDDAVSFPRLVAHTVSQGSVFGLLNAVEIDKTSPEGLHLTSPLTPGETVLYSSPAAQRQGDPGSLIFSDESNLASVSFNLKWGVRNADYFRRYHSSPSPAVAPAADTSIPRSILLAFLRTGGLSLLAGVDKVVAKAGSKGRGVEGLETVAKWMTPDAPGERGGGGGKAEGEKEDDWDVVERTVGSIWEEEGEVVRADLLALKRGLKAVKRVKIGDSLEGDDLGALLDRGEGWRGEGSEGREGRDGMDVKVLDGMVDDVERTVGEAEGSIQWSESMSRFPTVHLRALSFARHTVRSALMTLPPGLTATKLTAVRGVKDWAEAEGKRRGEAKSHWEEVLQGCLSSGLWTEEEVDRSRRQVAIGAGALKVSFSQTEEDLTEIEVECEGEGDEGGRRLGSGGGGGIEWDEGGEMAGGRELSGSMESLVEGLLRWGEKGEGGAW